MLQQVSRSDQGWRRRLPSGTLAAMSARERLEARRCIERLLDEDQRRVAPLPEKAMTPGGLITNVVAAAWRAQQQPCPSGVSMMNGDERQGDANRS